MRRKPSAKVASAGVTHTQMAIEDDLGWLFRLQPTEDYGIDAQVEIVDGQDVSGKLLALQIKGGTSWFKEPGVNGWWFRPDVEHVQYWTKHSLPVVVVLYDPGTGRCHWQHISRETLVETSTNGWKVLVPEAQVLGESARFALQKAAESDPYELRLRELRLAKPWMEMLASGTRLVVDFAEWVNKMSGRGSVSIGIDHEDSSEPEKLVSWHFLAGPRSYAEAVPKLFAWADSNMHEETYYQVYEAECRFWNEDDELFTMTYDEWWSPFTAQGISPYDNAAGEIDYFRIELTLSELGKAFLIVDQFAAGGVQQLTADGEI